MKSFVVAWAIAVFVASMFWKIYGPQERDGLLWFVPPFLMGTFIILPALYLVAYLF